MTYNVFSGTLNPTQSINRLGRSSNNNNQANVYGAVNSTWKAIARVHPVHLTNDGWLPTLRPSQPTWPVSLPVDCYHPRPPSPLVRELTLISLSHGGWKAEST